MENSKTVESRPIVSNDIFGNTCAIGISTSTIAENNGQQPKEEGKESNKIHTLSRIVTDSPVGNGCSTEEEKKNDDNEGHNEIDNNHKEMMISTTPSSTSSSVPFAATVVTSMASVNANDKETEQYFQKKEENKAKEGNGGNSIVMDQQAQVQSPQQQQQQLLLQGIGKKEVQPAEVTIFQEKQQLSQTPLQPIGQPEDEQGEQVRRSGRARKSTTIKINGEIVLAKNNYVVTGSGYKYGIDASPVDKVEEEKRLKRKRAEAERRKRKRQEAAMKRLQEEGIDQATADGATPVQHRKKSAKLDARMKHNNAIKERIANDEIQRKKFMTSHIDILLPFIDEKVKQSLLAGIDGSNVPLSPSRKKAATLTKSQTIAIANEEEDDKKHVYMQPDLLKTEMRDYQLLGLEWMVKMHKRGTPMILGDEMGLGKTLQTISLLCYLKEHEKTVSGPSLVVCPLSVLYSWCNEIQKHAPDLQYFRFHASDPKEREVQKESITNNPLKYDVIITTYEMVKNPMIKGLISGLYFNYVVLDEGHIIKDISTQISVAVRKIHSQNTLILTGTPLQNNLVELYAILNYLYPDIFTKAEYFAKAFDIGKNEINPQMLLAANKVLNLFMIRRLKEEVEKLMPKKIETKIICPLSSIQVFWYKSYLMKDIDALASASERTDEELATNASRYNILRNLVMQLRKCCLHPFLFKGAESNIHATTPEELIAASGKLAVLDKMLRSMFKRGNRTVIFSQFTSMLDILEDYCRMRQWKYCRFDGSTPRAQRNYLINRFNDPGSTDFIFLMSTRSGGLGINLQTADTCILYDSDWNPQPDIQAMARVHRIGQKNTVHVYRLVSGGTVEERVLERAEKKLYLDQMVNRGDRGAVSSKVEDKEAGGLTTAELLSTLKFGSNAVFSSSNELPSDKDINTITDRRRSEDTSAGLLQGGIAKTAKDFDTEKELTSTTKLNGVDFKAIRDEQKKDVPKLPKSVAKLREDWGNANIIADHESGGRGKRVKTNRLVMVQGIGTGYGKAYVPVLARNNYALEDGESSVFANETKKTAGFANPKNKKKTKAFVDNQDFCQICGYAGGMIILCPRCPVSVHEQCCGVSSKDFLSCTHHRCARCGKNTQGAGGLLFACQTCPNSYCEDCLPTEGLRFLGRTTPRFEKLGFFGTPNTIYVHCSDGCEDIAKKEFGWKCPLSKKQKCPEIINVSYAFGENALTAEEIATRRATGIPLVTTSRTTPGKATTEPSRKSPRKRSRN